MNFFQYPPYPVDQIEGFYDLKLVFISCIVAIFASYVAFNIVENIKRFRRYSMNFWNWLLSGALVMGLGIWTMHFIGMEAFTMYMPMEYDPYLTFLSLLIAILASGFALFWITRNVTSISAILFGGVLMGIAIATMHYVGMSAMLHIHINYIPSLFFLSILIAILASQAALWLIKISHGHPWGTKFNFLSAIVMGAAISGMHYTGMAAAVISAGYMSIHANQTNARLPDLYIGAGSAGIILIYLALSSLKKNIQDLQIKEIELEKALERAGQANVAKRYFLANMSHEIRTPLNAIIGTASLLARSELNEKEKKYVERITLSSQLLLNLVMDILDFSRIEAGEFHLNLIHTDFITIVKEVVKMTEAKAEERNLKIIINYDASKPLAITSDPIRIQQVITNLVVNAIKFSRDGIININITSKQEKQDYLSIRLEVEDKGIGISEDKFDLIFQKFSQVDNSSTRKFGGSGLGLVISKQLVELLGGKIGFKSKLGEGSTFWFEITFPK